MSVQTAKTTLLLIVIICAVGILLGPQLMNAVRAAQQISAGSYYAESAAWRDIPVELDAAREHAIAKHGEIAASILEAVRFGRCDVYLQCGYTWSMLRDGVKGYFVCSLPNGQRGIVPFYYDALRQRIVPMTAFPARAGYEQWLARRDNCAPMTSILGLLDQIEKDDY